MSPSKGANNNSVLNINDNILIGWLKEEYKHIEFVVFKPPYDTYHRSEELVSAIDKLDQSQQLHTQKDKLKKLWKSLVGNAIVYLKSKDSREEHHDDEDYGVDRLYEFFTAFCDFEGLLYGANEYYRDHVTHMFRVFLLGMYLIRKKLGFEHIRLGRYDLLEKSVTPSEKEAMWCIVSLAHDLGYALETISEINKKARNMLDQFGEINVQELSYTFPRQPLCDFLINFISSDLHQIGKQREYITHVQSKYFLKFSGAFERYLHGIISCIVLMRNLVYFLESDFTLDNYRPLDTKDAKHFLIRNNILRSIASHNCDDIYYLTVAQFPFLLRIFDEMQEWERPRLQDLFTQKIPKTALLVIKLDPQNVHYKIEVEYTDSLSDTEREQLKKDIREYFKRKCGRIRRILRSAVDGKQRDFTLIFEVADRIPPDLHDYKITHRNPGDIETFVGSKKIDWIEI